MRRLTDIGTCPPLDGRHAWVQPSPFEHEPAVGVGISVQKQQRGVIGPLDRASRLV
jgi:hypothetical protein